MGEPPCDASSGREDTVRHWSDVFDVRMVNYPEPPIPHATNVSIDQSLRKAASHLIQNILQQSEGETQERGSCGIRESNRPRGE